MSVFNPNIPQPTDDLSVSQGQILQNFQKSNSSFGIDHYTFSDATINNGFHNQVTTPLIIGGVHPTTVSSPILYAMQDTANVGVIQYSRGPNNAVPTPLTHLQSPVTGLVLATNGTTNVLDFTGLTKGFCTLYAADTPGISNYFYDLIYWSGTQFAISVLASNSIIQRIKAQASGNILQIINTGSPLSNIYWTLVMDRIG